MDVTGRQWCKNTGKKCGISALGGRQWTSLEGEMVAREGIEPPTRGFSVIFRGFEGFINQSLAASCRPLPRHTKAQSWRTQSELVTSPAQLAWPTANAP